MKQLFTPTYTAINLETRMKKRQTTIQDCMKMTEELIEESEHKQNEEQAKLESTVQLNANNFGNAMSGFTLMFHVIQQSIAELKTHDNTILVARPTPPPTQHKSLQIINSPNTQDNNIQITEIKDDTPPKEKIISSTIISPED